ncbi:TonB family protein [Acinetobacter bereziniae]|jgi:TonB family protein|uniref:TonB family protein n=1 Tax=Acinetobacter TaxID=469 RepID=UPI0002AE9645|nr:MULTISPECIES: TonB family protein [Acinetobacter]ELW82844.1 TonB-dependent receptor [Acinetobacter sp. WC-743]MBJ8427086.1 TonB family protein [Acinetobacter bereziniae]MBJ8446049.1 TonB family protein [Acinetobacter bereziniae]MBJ8476778.1 TonB family protein [Acinetobacter bereziniae]MBJ9371147.1 TonB family protein [Acinetobacter sp. TGL-Y2]
MNKALLITGLMCLSTYGHSAEKLPTIKVKGEQSDRNAPLHLTTRIQWVKFPQVQYQTAELKTQDRSAIIRVSANSLGQVTDAEVQESTGITALDQKLIDAVEAAKVKPYSKNGKAIPIVGYQTFTLNMDNAQDNTQAHAQLSECTFAFNSKHWIKQTQDKSVAFHYTQQPQLSLDSALLKNKDRTVKFKFKVDQQGNVKRVKLTQLSGVNAIDQQVIQAVEQTQIQVKRSYRTLWTFKPRSFNDEIQFKINDCNEFNHQLK